MDTYEEDITNEKDLISKDYIEKSNSLAIKSLDETSFDFLELLKEKYFLFITLKKTNYPIQISNKSIIKIFEFFCGKNNKENLEEVLLDHIACTINEKEDFNSMEVLDMPFVELLKKTKNYKINFTKKQKGKKAFEDIKKNLLIYEEQDNKLNVKANSVKKIFKLLGKNIFDMCDYINILVLYLNEDEINKFFIQNKIVDKYDKSGELINLPVNKQFEVDLVLPEKNKKNSIFKLNSLFDKILNKLDNVEDLSDLSLENGIEEKIQKEKNNIPKRYIEQKIKGHSYNFDGIDNNKINDEDNELPQGGKFNCQKDLCEKCNIF